MTTDPNLAWKVSRALLDAATQVLTDAGLTVPEARYVSTRGEVNLEFGACGCEQLVVIPTGFADPNLLGIGGTQCAWRHQLGFDVAIGRCITEFQSDPECPLDLGEGGACADPFVPPTPEGSVQHESWITMQDRWVLWTDVPSAWQNLLCECLDHRVCSNATVQRLSMTSEASGSCEWSTLAVTVRV